MDYCSSCRRHLNGALVCPGCGAYAPDIDPTAGEGRTGRAPATARAATAPAAGGTASGGAAAWEYPAAAGTWHDGTLWDGNPAGSRDRLVTDAGHREAAGTGPDDGLDVPDDGHDGHGVPDAELPGGYAARPQGRAARRRQMARWKKNQRRAVVATAVALVGGGLTVAAMNGNATPGVQAATAPEDTTMGGAEGEAPTYTEPTAGENAAPRSSPTAPPHTGRASRHQQARAADPRTASADARTDAATPPRELPLTTSPRRTTAANAADTATGSTGSTGSSGSSGSSGSGAAEPTAPPPAARTPSSRRPGERPARDEPRLARDTAVRPGFQGAVPPRHLPGLNPEPAPAPRAVPRGCRHDEGEDQLAVEASELGRSTGNTRSAGSAVRGRRALPGTGR
ncbi:SCO2400 family protein [Streptomyces levis]|uniref:SCO2400 family protein n=1 Tax=Streptomyces levis TaxID=285566 RepID=UPI003C7B98D2